MDVDGIVRHPASSYVAAVLLPSALVAAPWLYAEDRIRAWSGIYGIVYLALLSLFFLGQERRIARLVATDRQMAQYRGYYVLLLRSFGRTEGYASTAADRGPDGWATPPLETSEIGAMEAAVRACGLRLVALGGDFLLPAGHRLFWLTSRDVDWEANFAVLASGAHAILICPETSQGIRHEIATLRRTGQLSKAVFLMAPRRQDRTATVETVDPQARATRWEAHRQALAADGIELPAYDAAGCFFTLDAQLRVAGRAPVPRDFHLATARRWTAAGRRRDGQLLQAAGAAMLALLPEPASPHAPWSEVMPRLALGQPIHAAVNHLHPPGADLWLPWLSFSGWAWGLFHNALAVVFTFASAGWVLLVLLLGLSVLGLGSL